MSEDPRAVEALRAEVAELRRKLEESEARAKRMERLASIAESTADFVGMSTPKGEIFFINKGGRKLCGFGPDEDLSNLHAHDLVAERDRHRIVSEGRPAALRDGTWTGEISLMHRDGHEIPVSILITAHLGPAGEPLYTSAIMRDIRPIKRLTSELRAAEERLRHLLRASPLVIYTASVDPEVRITFVSDSVTELFGYAPESFTSGFGFWVKRLHPEDARRVIPQLRRVLETGQNGYEYRFLDSKGRYRWMLDQHRLMVDASGKPIEIVGSLLDITERKEAEDLVMQLSTPLIPVSDQVLVMPLIGRIDEGRAGFVISTLLEGISRRRAQVAILDITGVDRVDGATATALITAAQAVQLLGAEVVLTGIRPGVAQALVQLGTDLGRIVTLGSLQAGIAYAMRER